MKYVQCALVAAMLLVARPAAAEPTVFADDAVPVAVGHGQMALLASSRVGIAPGVELHSSAPGWLLLAPNGGVKVLLRRTRSWAFSGDVGLALPTLGMRIVSGYLFPSNEVSGAKIGPILTAQTGFIATYTGPKRNLAAQDDQRLTFQFDTAFKVLGAAPTPPETYSPLELLVAPATSGLRVHASAVYALAFAENLHGFFGVDGYYLGASPAPKRSPFAASVTLGITGKLSRRFALSGGIIGYNSDQRRTEIAIGPHGAERRKVRNNDLFPVVDVAFAF